MGSIRTGCLRNLGEEVNENQSKSAQSELSEFQNIALENIKLVPNPTTGELRIENGELRIMSVEVFDVYGRNCHVSRVTSSENDINISHLPAGVYFVKISTEAGEVTKKIVKH